LGILWDPKNLNFANGISAARCIVPFLTHLFFRMGYATSQVFLFWHFVFWALSDALDGPVARKDGNATRLGAILDPLGDKMLFWTELFRRLDQLFWWAVPFVVLLVLADAWSTLKRFFNIYSSSPLEANVFGKLKTAVLFVLGITPFYLVDLNWFPGRSYQFILASNLAVVSAAILDLASIAKKEKWF